MDGYRIIYEKRYGTSIVNPWSQETLLKNNVRVFPNGDDQTLWIKAGPYAYCFIKDFDKIEDVLNNESASEAKSYLEKMYDRKENVQEIIDKWSI